MNWHKFYLAFFSVVLSLTGYCQTTISVTGNPVFPSTVFDVTEAGNDFVSSVVSTDGSLISIDNTETNLHRNGKFNWSVSVNKSDINWNPTLGIQVRRSGDGTEGSNSNNSITGGTNFQSVSDIPSTFFEGTAARDNVPIEYQISNISVLIPADNYETTVYFTVYEQ